MNYQQMPKTKNPIFVKIFAIGTLIIMSCLLLPVTYAAEPVETKYTCDTLNHLDKVKGQIVTIIEEPIGKPDATDPYTVLNCFRETACKKIDNKNQCLPSYKDTCSYDPSVICQPIQAYFSSSGAGLIYAYIGNIYRWAATVVGIASVFYMVVGGIQIATARGESGVIDEAKGRILQSIAGLVLLFLSGLFLYTLNPNFFIK